MRFAVIGAALAEAGHGVTFIVRGDHLKAMQENGLRIVGEQPRRMNPVQATQDPTSSTRALLYSVD